MILDDENLRQILRQKDPPSYFSLTTLNSLNGNRVSDHRVDIFSFLRHKYGEVPLDRYLRRVRRLRELQKEFEKTHAYPASCYADVRPIDGHDYNVALLLSFVLTNHRFEIISALQEFLREPTSAPPDLLSIGFGTGYELKLASDILPSWRYHAYDISAESSAYASELLRFFNCPNISLHTQSFPLETATLPAEYEGRFGKIVLCELLEHLEHPETALGNMRLALHPAGRIFATMAINIAQEDHVFLYRTVQQARDQAQGAGLRVVSEWLAPVAVIPFGEENRARLFTKGNYICVLARD
jgi:hypothetical protein